MRILSFSAVAVFSFLALGCSVGVRDSTGGRDGVATVGPPTGTGVIYAGNTLDCGKKTYHVTTGTKGGVCNIKRDNSTGKAVQLECKDGDNQAGASCSSGCGNTSTGGGDCTQK